MRGTRPFAAAWLVLAAACATGTEGTDTVDASSSDGALTDATALDAPAIDGMVTDGMVTDAGCTTMVLQRLTNPAFDSSPLGTGWSETPHDAAFPIITPNDGQTGMVEHTAPNKAWLGGWEETAIDVMYQDVTIPAGTTQLTLRGQRWTATDESGSTVYDTCTVELQNTSGGLLQGVMTLSNVTTVASWTAFQFTFSNPYAGQTVRLNFRASSDSSFATAFWFDSLALEATVCQ